MYWSQLRWIFVSIPGIIAIIAIIGTAVSNHNWSPMGFQNNSKRKNHIKSLRNHKVRTQRTCTTIAHWFGYVSLGSNLILSYFLQMICEYWFHISITCTLYFCRARFSCAKLYCLAIIPITILECVLPLACFGHGIVFRF